MRETGDVGGWTRDLFVKQVMWGVDVESVPETGDVAGGHGIRSGNR